MVNIALVRERLQLSFVTAAKLIEGLAELGVVEEITGARRNRVYRYSPYLALFADDTSRVEPAETQEADSGQQRLPIA